MARFEAKKVLLEQLEKDTTLLPRQKALIRLTLALRPRKAEEILGEVTFASVEAGVVSEDGKAFATDEAGIDWSKIDWAALFQIILQIIKMFF